MYCTANLQNCILYIYLTCVVYRYRIIQTWCIVSVFFSLKCSLFHNSNLFGSVLFTFYTGCNRRNGPDFGRVFLMLNYTEKPQNTYIQKFQGLRRYRPEKSVDFFGVCVLYSICDVILGVSERWAPSTTIAFPRYR